MAIFGYFICRSFRVSSNEKIYYEVLRTSLWFYWHHLWYRFPRFYFWFSWNVTATLLSVVEKRTKDLCFSTEKKHCTVNTIHCVVWHTINKVTVKIFTFTWSLTLMKDNFRENQSFFEGHNPLSIFSPPLSCQAPTFFWNISNSPIKDQTLSPVTIFL